MSLIDAFDPKRPARQPGEADFVQLRVVPFQPENIQPGYVYLGNELGIVHVANEQPRPGDTVAVLGQPGGYIAIKRTTPPERDPLFAGGCKCRCPASSTGGMVAYLCTIEPTSILFIVDGADGAILYYSTLPEVFSGHGIAIDPEPPHDLYILDDRSGGQNLSADGIPASDPNKQWLFLLKYTTDGTTYTFNAVEELPGYPSAAPGADFNTLTVLDGVCHITIGTAPAQFLKWSGAGFTAVPLTLDNASYNAYLVGNIARVEKRPAVTSQLYSIAIFNPAIANTWQLLRFTPAGAIVNVLESPEFEDAQQLLTTCNRLWIFQCPGPFRGDITE